MKIVSSLYYNYKSSVTNLICQRLPVIQTQLCRDIRINCGEVYTLWYILLNVMYWKPVIKGYQKYLIHKNIIEILNSLNNVAKGISLKFWWLESNSEYYSLTNQIKGKYKNNTTSVKKIEAGLTSALALSIAAHYMSIVEFRFINQNCPRGPTHQIRFVVALLSFVITRTYYKCN